MTKPVDFLKSLISISGLSGFESPVAELIAQEWKPLVSESRISNLGSLEALKRGMGESPRPSIMIATHMDAIGLMVTSIVDGFLYFTSIGGVDPRVLPGTLVTVHAGSAKEELPGVIAQPAARLLPASIGDAPVPIDYLLVDTGLTPKQVQEKVRVGDTISFASPPCELSGDYLVGHSLDNRASVASLTIALEGLQNKSHVWDVWAVATAQEETILGGAFTSAFGLRPDIAVAVDVTFGKGPGASDWQTHAMGKGPSLGFGPNVHPYLYKKFKELAEKLEIPHDLDPLPRMSGTDAHALQVSAEGIPTMVISIPLRYMHTPVEMVSIKDILRTGRLLAEFIAGLDANFMNTISWDD